MIKEAKQRIRKEILDKLNKQTNRQRLRKSRLIKKQLFELAEFRRARCVMFYIATDKEVQTEEMILAAQKIGKQIVVPKILVGKKRMIASEVKDFKTEITQGTYGIPQPKQQYTRRVPVQTIDLVVVPGLAFDRQCRRLGRGGGYYDKFLAQLGSGIARIGLAFNCQLRKRLPFSSHDICVTRVISA